MSYFKRNEGPIVFAFASFAFIAFYCVKYFIRRCRDRERDIAAAAAASTAGDTTDSELSTRRSPRGLNAREIESFPSFIYTETNGIGPGQGELVCVVCLNEYNDYETLRLLSPCAHVFHAGCVDTWLSCCSTCPICRADVAP